MRRRQRHRRQHRLVVFNSQQTVNLRNDKFKSGPVALQSAGGTIRFRKVSIKVL